MLLIIVYIALASLYVLLGTYILIRAYRCFDKCEIDNVYKNIILMVCYFSWFLLFVLLPIIIFDKFLRIFNLTPSVIFRACSLLAFFAPSFIYAVLTKSPFLSSADKNSGRSGSPKTN